MNENFEWHLHVIQLKFNWFNLNSNSIEQKIYMTMQIDVKGIENMMSFPSFMIMVLRKREKKIQKDIYIWSDIFA